MSCISRIIVLFLLAVINATSLADILSEEEDLSLAFGDEDFISIATGNRQLLTRAPAVASVITAEDIKVIGATDLDQVLETVPGLHVSRSTRGYNPIYTIRGIYSETNPQVLVLINDIPITNVFVGDRNQVWGGMPVNNIARIEIIRGPGSAVHGADAFAGTINIVTKTAADIGGTEFGVKEGTFDTTEAWLLNSGSINGIGSAFSIEVSRTDGQDEIITADAMTFLDPAASLAPGPVNLRHKNLDARLDLSRGNWRARFGYQRRLDVGIGAGVAQALDPVGDNSSTRLNTDFTYHDNSSFEHWDLTTQLSMLDTNAKSDLLVYPPGAFGGTFPDGMIGKPEIYERHTRFSVSGVYDGIDGHQLRIGIGYNIHDMYKIRESKNFDSSGAPLGSVVDVSDDPNNVFIRPHDRKVYFLSLQDEWSMAADWDLTGGVRYDHYSDFGTTVNPRLALVWQTQYNLTSKFLYGRAFRAPSFAELYNINNPVALGNASLDPETIDTLELAFDYQPSEKVHTDVNLFRYKMRHIIRPVPDPLPATTITAQNTGDQNGYGMEWEATWNIDSAWELKGNLAYQKSTDDSSNTDVADAPGMQAYIQARWKGKPDWELVLQNHWIGDRKRAAGDSRPAVDNIVQTDVTLRRMPKTSPLELTLSVNNLFDRDVREPSPAPGLIPNDLPLAGRNVMFGVIYHLDKD